MKIRSRDYAGEAIRWDGDNTADVVEFARGKRATVNNDTIGGVAMAGRDAEQTNPLHVEIATPWTAGHKHSEPVLVIEITTNGVRVPLGGWLIRQSSGPLKVLRNDAFERAFEVVSETVDVHVMEIAQQQLAAYNAARKIANILGEYGWAGNPVQLMDMIRKCWDRVAPLAYIVHTTPDITKR